LGFSPIRPPPVFGEYGFAPGINFLDTNSSEADNIPSVAFLMRTKTPVYLSGDEFAAGGKAVRDIRRYRKASSTWMIGLVFLVPALTRIFQPGYLKTNFLLTTFVSLALAGLFIWFHHRQRQRLKNKYVEGQATLNRLRRLHGLKIDEALKPKRFSFW
jgi:hypothetical protein